MAEAITVRSVEAVEQFRRKLVVFVAKAKPLVSDTFDDVSRTREWLRVDRRVHWQNELRRRKQALQDAEEKYFSARLSTLREATTAELMAVRRAKANVEAAEEKLRVIKRWTGEFEHSVWPLLKQLEQLETRVTHDLPAAWRFLAEIVKALDAYRDAAPERPLAPQDDAVVEAKS
jgi:hypothetical protein